MQPMHRPGATQMEGTYWRRQGPLLARPQLRPWCRDAPCAHWQTGTAAHGANSSPDNALLACKQKQRSNVIAISRGHLQRQHPLRMTLAAAGQGQVAGGSGSSEPVVFSFASSAEATRGEPTSSQPSGAPEPSQTPTANSAEPPAQSTSPWIPGPPPLPSPPRLPLSHYTKGMASAGGVEDGAPEAPSSSGTNGSVQHTSSHSTLSSGQAQPQSLPQKLYYGRMTLMQVVRSFSYRSLLLFLFGGGVLGWALVCWARGSSLQFNNPYTFNVTFPIAPSLEPGVPLRMKGVQVGSVTKATSGLEFVEAVVQVNQKTLRIPRSSTLVYNKAGPLSPAPFIEVQLPKSLNDVPEAQTPTASAAERVPGRGPSDTTADRDAGVRTVAEADGANAQLSLAAAAQAATAGPDQVDACRTEGLLLCAGDRVKGVQGGGMDELTALMLRSMKSGVEDLDAMPPVMRELVRKEQQEAAERAAQLQRGSQ